MTDPGERIFMRKAALVLLTIFGAMAFADQCAYITKTQAFSAAKVLRKGANVQLFCEPCGETKSTSVFVETVEVRKTGYDNYFQVLINGQGIDLAYTYVNGRNLGLAIGCDATNVSSFLSEK